MRGGRSVRPALAGGDAGARRRGLLAGMIDPWAASLHRPDDDPDERRIAAAADVGALRAGRQRVRAPARASWSSTSTRWRSSRSTTTGSCPPARARQLRRRPDDGAGQRAGVPGAARRRPADRDHPARGRRLHRRRAPRRLAEVARAHRLHPARGPRPARDRLRRERPDHLPRVAGRDVRPLRRPGADASPQERLRPGRVRGRLAGELADARLRLRRRDPLLRRRRQRPGRGAGHDRERDLHARGGRRHRLEAHGLPHRGGRGAAAAAARDLLDRHRRQLRVRLLLVPLHRRHDRVRGQAHRASSRPAPSRSANGPRTARSSRPASTARTTSTSSACGWTWRSTARATPSSRSTPSRCPRPRQPARHRVGDEAHASWPPSREAQRTSTRCAGAPGASRTRPGLNAVGDPGGLQPHPGRERRADVRPRLALRPARRLRRQAPLGDRVRPGGALRGRRLPEPAPGRQRPAALRPPTARSRTPTSSSGTRSAPTTSSVPRTGR